MKSNQWINYNQFFFCFQVPPQDAVFDDAVFETALDYGLDQEAVTETAVESPKVGIAARNACNRKQPEKYVPSM